MGCGNTTTASTLFDSSDFSMDWTIFRRQCLCAILAGTFPVTRSAGGRRSVAWEASCQNHSTQSKNHLTQNWTFDSYSSVPQSTGGPYKVFGSLLQVSDPPGRVSLAHSMLGWRKAASSRKLGLSERTSRGAAAHGWQYTAAMTFGNLQGIHNS